MKKIFLGGAIVLLSLIMTNVSGQEHEFALSQRKELRHEKKQINTEEKGLRKEKKTNRHSEVSYITMQQFGKDFPYAKETVFTVGKNFEEAAYKLNGQDFIAYYDEDSKLVGTTTDKQMIDLPVRAQKIINNKYRDDGYSIESVILFDDSEANTADMFMYDQQFNDQDVYFVELKRADKKAVTVLQVNLNGDVSFFKSI